jgi:tetratricopeptide (TPR) repeat protein
MATVFACADYVIYPSLAEGFGLPLLEAMACGTPVMASNSTSLPEVGGEAVLFFNPRDPDDLSASMDALETSPGLRQQMREAGILRARHFTWTRAAEETFSVYGCLSAEASAAPVTDPSSWGEAVAADCADPAHREWMRDHAWTLAELAHPEAIVPILESSLSCRPDNPDTLRELGKLMKRQGRWGDALSVFKRMLIVARKGNREDHRRSALYHLAECELELGRAAAARAHLRQCLDICPDHKAAQKLLRACAV